MLQPLTKYCVPVETDRVAKAIFPGGNIYLTMADVLETFPTECDFADLFSAKGQPAVSPFRRFVSNNFTVH